MAEIRLRLLALDATSVMVGMRADPWQVEILANAAPSMLLLCSRQSGKSSVAAALALRHALLKEEALVLLLSPTERQSVELARKVRKFYLGLGRPLLLVKENVLEMEFTNGSRIVALPGIEKNLRSYSNVSLLVFDEAARVPDDLYAATRPMLAVSQGRIMALSTPFGKRGWFWEAWTSEEPWRRVRITADQCPRITPEFLDSERRAVGERWFRQEYLCSFEDAVGAVFSGEVIAAAMSEEVKPLW